MREFSVCALVVTIIFIGAPRPATADMVDTAIGNTLSVMMEGVETRFYFDDDGSVSLADANGAEDTGQWERRDDQLCITWQDMQAGEPQCAELSQENPEFGATFSLASPDGGSQEATLKQGQVPF